MAVNSRSALKAYCLRELGDGINQIIATDAQIEDRIDEALLKFADFHMEGTLKTYVAEEITQDIIDNKYVEVDSDVIYVTKMFSLGSSSRSMFSTQYNMEIAAFTSLNDFIYGGGLSDYVQKLQNINSMRSIIQPEKIIDFSRHENRIYIRGNVDNVLRVGEYLIFECYVMIDPETFTSVYNDKWLKKYTTALIKKQQATNLSRYANTPLLGGLTLDAPRMYQEAENEIEKLEEELRNTYQLPPCIFMG